MNGLDRIRKQSRLLLRIGTMMRLLCAGGPLTRRRGTFSMAVRKPVDSTVDARTSADAPISLVPARATEQAAGARGGATGAFARGSRIGRFHLGLMPPAAAFLGR